MMKRMQSRMLMLDTMITVAPLLGILGTIIGTIGSFQMLGGGSGTDHYGNRSCHRYCCRDSV